MYNKLTSIISKSVYEAFDYNQTNDDTSHLSDDVRTNTYLKILKKAYISVYNFLNDKDFKFYIDNKNEYLICYTFTPQYKIIQHLKTMFENLNEPFHYMSSIFSITKEHDIPIKYEDILLHILNINYIKPLQYPMYGIQKYSTDNEIEMILVYSAGESKIKKYSNIYILLIPTEYLTSISNTSSETYTARDFIYDALKSKVGEVLRQNNWVDTGEKLYMPNIKYFGYKTLRDGFGPFTLENYNISQLSKELLKSLIKYVNLHIFNSNPNNTIIDKIIDKSDQIFSITKNKLTYNIDISSDKSLTLKQKGLIINLTDFRLEDKKNLKLENNRMYFIIAINDMKYQRQEIQYSCNISIELSKYLYPKYQEYKKEHQ